MSYDDLVCRPDDPQECSTESFAEQADHAMHGVELVHAGHELAEGHHTPTVPAVPQPGTGGPMDPDYWVDAQPASGRDLQDIYCALGEEAVQQESQMMSVPDRAPVGPDSSTMLDDMRLAGHAVPEAGSPPAVAPARAELDGIMRDIRTSRAAEREPRIGPEMDPAHIPGPDEPRRYPTMDGALDHRIEPTEADVGGVRTRVGSTEGDFLAVGDPTFSQRSVPPMRMPPTEFDPVTGRRLPFHSHREYTVARSFPEEESTVAPYFGGEGMATQVRAPISERALEAGGYLDLERETSYYAANADEICEIDDAVAGEAAAARPVASTPNMSEMVDNIDAQLAANPPPRTPYEAYGPPEGVQPAPTPTPATEASAVDSGASGAGGAASGGEITPFGQLMGAFGAAGGLYQMVTGASEVADGHAQAGGVDLGAGAVAAGTGLGMTGLLGEAAAVACAAPPVAVGAGLIGAAADGYHYNEQHGTFGTDDEGHNRTSIDFALDSGAHAYHGIHDAVAGLDPDSDVAEGAGELLGGVGAVGSGAVAGMIGLGGDLRYGVPDALGGLYDFATGYGDEYAAEHDAFGAPTVDEHGATHHVHSREMIEDSAHGSFDAVHDGIMGLTGDQGAAGVAGEVLGTTLGVGVGGVVGLGAGIAGAGGALLGTAGRAASDLYSWFAD